MNSGESAGGYLVFDTESIPDGRLLAAARYSGEEMTPEQAVARAHADALKDSGGASNFVNVGYCIPVAVAAVRVNREFEVTSVATLDAPAYRPAEITRLYWNEVCTQRPTLVTFNGRSFDLPLMELAAFRWGLSVPAYFTDHQGPRNRFSERHIDLQEFIGNYGAVRTGGGLNLLAKLLGKPGKMDVDGSMVYDMHAAGKLAEINDYCLCDALDTYFVFIRTRVLIGRIGRERERVLIDKAKAALAARAAESPTVARYLSRCGEWEPWPGSIAPAAAAIGAAPAPNRPAAPRRGGLG